MVWEKARKMQHKMSKTRSHVESRIIEITNLLAPPIASSKEDMQTSSKAKPAAETQSLERNKPIESESSKTSSPPSYEDATSQEASSAPPPYTETGNIGTSLHDEVIKRYTG